jgi:hypothetical protein
MTLLLAEELALLSIDPGRGRARLGERSLMNATLAGLLIAELVIDGAFEAVSDGARLVRSTAPEPANRLLAAAARIAETNGPNVKSLLRAMDRGLHREMGSGTWDSVLLGLVDAGVLAPSKGRWIAHHAVLAPAVRDEIVARLQAAAAGDGQLNPRTAIVLSMTGPAHLLQLVAPDRATRKHARRRIDHCLEETDLAKVGILVRKVLQEAQSAAAAGATIAVVASTG